MTQQTATEPQAEETPRRSVNDALLELPIDVGRWVFEALALGLALAGRLTWRLVKWVAPRYPRVDVVAYTVVWLALDEAVGIGWRPDAPWWVTVLLVAVNPVPVAALFLTWWYWHDGAAPETMDDYVAVWRSEIAGTLLDDDGTEEWARA